MNALYARDRHLAVEQLARLRRAEHRRHRERLRAADVIDVRVREHDAAHRPAELGDRVGERLPLRPHHERVDDREAVVVGDHAGVAHTRFAARLQPDPHAVGELVQGVGLGSPPCACTVPFAAMSERCRNLPRRSCLSIPGSSEKMLAKAPGLGADMVFLDLEDAVAPLEKPAARDKIVKAINDARLGRHRPVRARQRVGHRVDVPRRRSRSSRARRERLDELMLPEGASRPPRCRRSTCC